MLSITVAYYNKAGYAKYGYTNKDELFQKLKEMKEAGLITYKECEHPIFKGYPEGQIRLTNMGESLTK